MINIANLSKDAQDFYEAYRNDDLVSAMGVALDTDGDHLARTLAVYDELLAAGAFKITGGSLAGYVREQHAVSWLSSIAELARVRVRLNTPFTLR